MHPKCLYSFPLACHQSACACPGSLDWRLSARMTSRILSGFPTSRSAQGSGRALQKHTPLYQLCPLPNTSEGFPFFKNEGQNSHPVQEACPPSTPAHQLAPLLSLLQQGEGTAPPLPEALTRSHPHFPKHIILQSATKRGSDYGSNGHPC